MAAAGGAPSEGRPPLSRERIVTAALALADREGLDALTMRRLAADLGVAPMAPYTHVRSKEELLSAMFDAVIGSMDLPEGDGGDWSEELRSLGRSFRRAMLAHPGAVPLCVNEPPMGPRALRAAEVTFSVLRRAGFADRDIVRAFFTVVTYAMGFLVVEVAQTRNCPPEEREEMERQRKLQFESLPLDEFPNVVALAPWLGHLPVEEQFEYGLDRLIAGLEADLSPGRVRRAR
ncbi:MAG: TetR/AcrR family transcriptional regulator [Actinobacteria bacterium]|nr:TetR/AcrR family transcriptional regulator [Actinomycetota bacterium]